MELWRGSLREKTMPSFPRAWWRTVPVVCLAGSLAMQTADATARPVHATHAAPLSEFDLAERDRRALEAMPEERRTRQAYERVLDKYRAIYHTHPAAAHADASIAAVAELLAAEGRSFSNAKASRDAIAQYEFLRREYPGSKFRATALMREGEIFAQDLDDREAARDTFQRFLKQYPHSSLAGQVREEMNAASAPRQAVAKTPVKKQAPAPVLATIPAKTPPPVRASTSNVLVVPPPDPVPPPVPHVSRNSEPVALAMRTSLPGATADNAAPKPDGKLARVTAIRHWSTTAYTRVAIDLEDEVQFEAGRVTDPDRIFFDLHGTRLAAELKGKSFDVQDDGFLSKIRVAQFSNDMTRVVLNVSNVSDYSAFLLPNPYRLIIDVHGKPPANLASAAAPTPTVTPNTVTPNGTGNVPKVTAAKPPVATPSLTVAAPVKLTKAQRNGTTTTHEDMAPANTQASVENVASLGAQASGAQAGVRATKRPTTAPVVVKNADSQQDDEAAATTSVPAATAADRTKSAQASQPQNSASSTKAKGDAVAVAPAAAAPNPDATIVGQVGQVGQNAPTTKKAKKKTSGKPSAATDLDSAGAAAGNDDGNDLSAMTRVTVPAGTGTAPVSASAANSAVGKSKRQPQPEPTLTGAHEAVPTAAGERSLVRALGLKVGRIVVDAGHGGHDVGTLGVDGIQEKDVVLDVALRLGKLLKQRLGSDVIYTRDDDTFIPLETRTAIANKAQADLFISIHANSSPDPAARGVEVYYLNFTASPDALEVAARENAVSQNSIFQLSNLVKQITLRDKIEESHEFAADVDASLFNGITLGNPGLKDRGVKKAPFVVLIGANMPSILAEISFVTNADDARQLRDPNYRQRVAESLYRGVAKYANGLSGVRLAQNGRSGTNAEVTAR